MAVAVEHSSLDLQLLEEGTKISEWPLISSYSSMLLVFGTYLLLSLKLGPRYMRTKKPMELTNILRVYNVVQVAFNVYIMYLNRDAINTYLSFTSVPLEHHKHYMSSGIWLYYFSKILDLADTAFIILRKKDRQITFLHLYHHSSMIVCMWFFLRFYPGDYVSVYAFINSIVHIIMYTYYFLSSCGPSVQKYLWWKKYITRIQLLQFLIGMTYVSVVLATPQTISKLPLVINAAQGVFFICLFGNFYVKSYNPKK